MSFGVIVNTRTSPPARGGPTETDSLFLAAKVDTGSGGSWIYSMDDYVAAYGGRAGAGVPTFDYLDAAFQEGLVRAYVAPYATDYGDALTLMDDKRLGPGQIAAPGVPPTTQFYLDLQTAAEATNRVALRDVADDATIAQIETQGGDAPANDSYGATFGPWVEIPPPAGVFGSGPRQVPASAVIAALCARADQTGNPNRAAAGRDFPLQYATGFVSDVSDVDRAALFGAGVNAFKNVNGVLENYGFQTNIAMTPDNPYWQFNVARLRMFIKAQAEVLGEAYMFKPIDGRGLLAGALKGDLEHMLKRLYDADALYGDIPADAYSVTVTETVSDVAQGALKCVAEFVPSLHARSVRIDLVTVPIGSPV